MSGASDVVERARAIRQRAWGRLLVVVALWTLALLAATAMQKAGVAASVFDALRVALSIPYAGLVPGVLVLALAGVSLGRAPVLVYAVVASTAVLSAVFAVASLVYGVWPWGVAPPLSEPFVMGGTIAVVALLGAAVAIRRPAISLPRMGGARAVRPSVAVVAVALPVLAAVGAAVLTVDGPNVSALVALVAIAAVPLVAVLARFNRLEQLLVSYAVALALLLQNTVMTEFLKSGDANYEYYFSNLALSAGYWDPALVVNKNAMLRLTVLHPVHAQLTGLPLELEYRLVHPFLFATVAIGLYAAYEQYFGRRTTLFSVLLFCYLHPFFTRYSLDTRTAFGLLGLLAIVVAATDSDLNYTGKAAVAVTAVFVVVTSFYGTAIILGGFLVVGVAYAVLFGVRESIRPAVSAATAILTVVLTHTWYSRFAGGEALEVIVGATAQVVGRILGGDVSLGESAAGAATAETFSLTYELIRVEFVVLTLLLGFGALFVALGYPPLNRLVPRPIASRLAVVRADVGQRHPVMADSGFYLAATFAALGVLLSGFAPTTILGIERSYMIAGAVLFPYVFVFFDATRTAIRESGSWLVHTVGGRADTRSRISVLGRFAPSEEIPGESDRRPAGDRRSAVFAVGVPVVLAILLLVNGGVVAATVTEERSTQPLLDRERTLDEGEPPEVFHLYAHYTPRTDVAGAGWLHDTRVDEVRVYGSEATDPYPSYFYYTDPSDKRPPGPFGALVRRNATSGAGYVFVDEYSSRTGAINYREGDQRFGNTRFIPFERTVIPDSARLYSAGQTAVYLDRGRNRTLTASEQHAGGQ
ncbi:DUF2206 domain-containing protein [Halapricum hydrolyticum]|uniref:DUF2206 domain-containing protein n=1 Tax=Halapricum hydrolyticum TaxID=2979991 RepID=A0AAE3ID42_9EURY|nr:DUF2206 domain-containing protein [Halapricum hydrolyticum]MCU4718210.1 hypothetical protein [Halapricum hydrolyticum]MCU4726349.1 hypothetical protein [Halapricum hydrolyticum]